MRNVLRLVATVTFTVLATITLYAQPEFPLGVYLFDLTNVDYQQIRIDLGATWVQGWGGWQGNPQGVETNTVGLKALSIRNNIYTYSKPQKMRFEAERSLEQQSDTGLYNYFAQAKGERFADSRRCVVGNDSPGYIVSSPFPNTEFHYKQSAYLATFRLKVDKSSNGNSDAQVVRLKAVCTTPGHSHQNPLDTILINSNFPVSDAWQDFVFPFSMQVMTSGDPSAIYLAGRVAMRSDFMLCTSADIQVYWNGAVTTSLDYVDIEDVAGQALFAGTYDAALDSDMTGLPTAVARMYMTDEPYVSAFQSFNYVNSKINAVRPGATTLALSGAGISRFIEECNPSEVISDIYVFDSDVPSPSMTPAQASAVGVATWTTSQAYTEAVQERLERLGARLRLVIEPAVAAGKDFWYVPQLHGEYNRDQGQYRIPGRTILRPPTGLEIKASVWLAVAFGAKGIIGYPYGTHEWTDGVDAWTYTGLLSSDTGSDGIRRDHSANTATIDGSTVHTGYSEKWKGYKGVLAKLKDLGPTLASLHWQGAFYRRTWGTSMPAQFQMVGATTVTNVTTSDPAADTFVEVAHLKDDASVDYLVVVNLRTLASDARDVRVFFNGPKLVSRVGSDSSWFVGSGGSFVDRIAPGDGNLYKVEALNIAMTFGHVPSNTEYFITPGNTFHFGSGQSLYVTGTLTAIGTTSEPINFTTSDTNTFWSGINFYGSGASNSRIRNVSISNCSGYGVQVNGATGVTIENATINGNSNSQT